jgi:hypothetical protein
VSNFTIAVSATIIEAGSAVLGHQSSPSSSGRSHGRVNTSIRAGNGRATIDCRSSRRPRGCANGRRALPDGRRRHWSASQCRDRRRRRCWSLRRCSRLPDPGSTSSRPLGFSQSRNVLMRALRMWFGDASHLDVGHCFTFLVRGTAVCLTPYADRRRPRGHRHRKKLSVSGGPLDQSLGSPPKGKCGPC